MAHMPVGKTWLWSSVSAFVWTALLTGAGYFVGENWEVVGEYLKAYGWVVVGLVAASVLIQVVYYVRRRRAEPAGGGDAPA
jgi:membrane protein DedA with SNARE-associated domain